MAFRVMAAIVCSFRGMRTRQEANSERDLGKGPWEALSAEWPFGQTIEASELAD